MTRLARRALLALACAWPPSRRRPGAQHFPSRTITIIVPFAAGGPTDTVTRLVAEAMGRDLGQTVVVENAGGAGGTIGAQRVAQARPDGYTLLLHHIGMATTPSLYRRLAYDPVGGFEPIGLVTEVPMTLVAKKRLPGQYPGRGDRRSSAASSEKLNYANAGIGAASHLCGLLLMKAVDTPMTTVPFRGTGPAMQELLAGRIDLMCDQTTSTTEQINGGADQGLRRHHAGPAWRPCPNVPTSAEAGLPDFEVTVWHGLYAPKGTPAERSRSGCRRPCRWRCATRSWSPASPSSAPRRWRRTRATPAAHRAFWLADIAKWKPIIQARRPVRRLRLSGRRFCSTGRVRAIAAPVPRPARRSCRPRS